MCTTTDRWAYCDMECYDDGGARRREPGYARPRVCGLCRALVCYSDSPGHGIAFDIRTPVQTSMSRQAESILNNKCMLSRSRRSVRASMLVKLIIDPPEIRVHLLGFSTYAPLGLGRMEVSVKRYGRGNRTNHPGEDK